MYRKLVLAAAAALTLGAGMFTAPNSANAEVGVYFGSPGYYGGGRGYYPRHYYAPAPRYRYYAPRRQCERVVVRRWDGRRWRRIVERRCWR